MDNTLTRQQKFERLKELFRICGERHKASGNPRKSTDCRIYLAEEEQEEFLSIARELSVKPAENQNG